MLRSIRSKAKYHLLINQQVSTSFKHLNDSKVFVEYPNCMNAVDKNINEYN